MRGRVSPKQVSQCDKYIERVTGIEPVTVCLEGKCATTALHPHRDNRRAAVSGKTKYINKVVVRLRLPTSRSAHDS
jgi:hypothetical protein